VLLHATCPPLRWRAQPYTLMRRFRRLEAGEADGVLVTKLDRLTRSVRDLGDLVDRYFASRFSLLSVADAVDTRSAAGRLVLNVLASVGQWEREATGERTREVLSHLKAQGVKLGGAALGWSRSREKDEAGRRVVSQVDDEVAAVRRICELRRAGKPLRTIAATLTADGCPTKLGGCWHASTVRAPTKLGGCWHASTVRAVLRRAPEAA
jgi:site-specific DNA recombinase